MKLSQLPAAQLCPCVNEGIIFKKRIIKMALIMKLTILLVLLTTFYAQADGFSQQITAKVHEMPMSDFLKLLEKKSGISILFSEEVIKGTKPITLEVNQQSLLEVLNHSLPERGLSYKVLNNYILIKKAENRKLPGIQVVPQDTLKEISGFVLDEGGSPLTGASVKVKNTGIGTFTSINGKFALKNTVPGTVLIVSFIGFKTKEFTVEDYKDNFLHLTPLNSKLDEVVVIAYGTTTQRLSTGNVYTVKAKDIGKQPVNNPLLALQGRVPGLFISQSTGLPGSGITVRLQGKNSISTTNGNEPLYVVDGVPYASQMLVTTKGGMSGLGVLGASGTSGGGGNPLSYLNPGDIESIDVLKDADATAIYGSRAANGAILITTKRGKAGPARTEFNLQQGWGKVNRMQKLMNTDQYLEMRKEAFKNDNIAIPSILTSPNNTDYDVNGLWDASRYTDWQKELIGGTAQYTNLNATISGGSTNAQYVVGGTFHRETTVLPSDFSDKKGSIHFSLNTSSFNQKFKLQFTGNYMADVNQLPAIDPTQTTIYLAPDAPALYNPDGSLNWALRPSGVASWTNPMAALLSTYKNNTDNLISNLTLSYKVIPDLEIKGSVGYTKLETKEFQANPAVAVSPDKRPTYTRQGHYSNSSIGSWIIEPQANYRHSFGKGKLDVLVGSTIQQKNNNGEWVWGLGYNSDQVIEDMRSAASVIVMASENSTYKYNALFGRVNFNWLDKYIINMTARRDGSSRFGPKNRFHNFGAIGAAWLFSQEAWMKDAASVLSFGKLRGSYGTTGNDQIPDYSYMNLYTPFNGEVPYQNASGLIILGLTNPYLEWEETKKLQVGIDLGFFKDRVLLTANYVRNRSGNQLLPYNLPSITGFASITSNFPAVVENQSWEFALNTSNIKSNKFSWNSSVNLTIPKNKLIAFPDLATSQYADILVIGQPLDVIKNNHLIGVDPKTGVYQFTDQNGKPTFAPAYPTDQTVLVSMMPKFYGGFENSFEYKGWQLDFLFQFVKQVTPLNYNFRNSPGRFSSGTNNQPVTALQRWQKEGDIALIQKYSQNSSLTNSSAYAGGSDHYDASYIRWKNLSLSYQLPESWRKKAHLQNGRIYVQGQNLLTFTKFNGPDPETGMLTLPPLRVITIGLNVTL